jgi:hypothetical protein
MTTARRDYTATLLSDGRVLMVGGSGDTSAELYDPETGKFSPTGSTAEARLGQTATRLSDGRVLIAGGLKLVGHTLNALARAELYDPKTGTFSPTGSLATARWRHTASLLRDGRVLIMGGITVEDSAIPLASAELYDPTTGTFSPTGSMTAARNSATATLLSDGRVLIAGGNDGSADLASAELYQP